MELRDVTDDKGQPKPGKTLIKDQLRRSFHDRANEALPDDLMNLINKLREQDEQNGK